MKRLVVAWLIAVLLGASGCRTAEIQNVTNASLAPPPSAAVSLADVSRTIASAGRKLGWRIEEVRPGQLLGTLSLRTHLAIVTITHDTASFSITYRDSTNLLQSGNEIHRKYNQWVHNLATAIQREIALLPSR
jgi:hypothetical protein